ncbi:chemotaxis protein CheW [Shouchella clausii]|uniref:chemotaxis protein CheW n=1 Tax=Shouchella clausii TaxID=79880 RepID=UPI0021484DC0|nr:chemotaxis protein CheA [Shouchella clausii]
MTQYDYIGMFLEEADEHLQAMNAKLLQLEQDPFDKDAIAEIFRSAHTLKGMSATMGFNAMAELTHSLENLLDAMRDGNIEAGAGEIDLLFDAVEYLEASVSHVRNTGGELEEANGLRDTFAQLLGQERTTANEVAASLDTDTHAIMDQAVQDGVPVQVIHVEIDDNAALKGVRAFMVASEAAQFGELIHTEPSREELEEGRFASGFTLTAATTLPDSDIKKRLEGISEVKQVTVTPYKPEKKADKAKPQTAKAASEKGAGAKGEQAQQKTIRVNVEKLDSLMYLFEELVVEKGRLELVANSLQTDELTNVFEKVSRITSHLQEVMLSVRLMPLEPVFSRFPRMVRKVSKEIGKQIRFVIEGETTELDRAIIDEIGDPLLHLLRNSIDHGIEEPAVRQKSGKDPEGLIVLRAFYSGSHVVIEIEDDGAGIKQEKVLKKAIENELITAAEAEKMASDEINQLLFAPGFSTANEVTDLSGRGVGLDVVKSTFSALGGEIAVSSKEGEGTRFSISLPLTVSIIDAMMVELGSDIYAFPIANIAETAYVQKSELKQADGQSLFEWRGQLVPLVSLNEQFGLPEKEDEQELAVLLLYRNQTLMAVKVDRFIGKQEVVLKPLGSLLKGTKGISGGTILGDGTIALIVDIALFFNN